ncbi:MAG TPA: hypothetical protein ENH45_01180 [Nitrospirae bacterium]|nr:hypothetical protein BMS3Bbin09_01846 [bacterium BMS3Bbin09]HDH34503.1 hypothetical protein [Nitrospirota bacterium]HDZ83807.1 hypothetical protein [Nitrospirota bacterium]
MKRISILFILIALMSFGCGKDNVKPSEDSLLATEAFKNINILKEAYEGKSRRILQDRIAPHIASGILKDLYFDSAELDLSPRMVKIQETDLVVNINWKGLWQFPDETRLENRGVADLIFDRKSMKLLEIKGDNPFSIPSLESR